MARNRKAKEYASLAGPAAEPQHPAEGTTPDSTLPQVQPLEPWIAGDLKMRQLAQRIETDYLDFCTLAKQAMEQGWHTRFGFVDPGDYFEERIGLSWRTLRRRFTILEAIEKLPPADQAEAKATMVELGSHKAAALAPILREEGADWKKAAEFARGATEEAVQSMVSEKLNLPHRGLRASQHPGDRFLGYILNTVPPEEHDRVERAFTAGFKILESHNAMAVFLVMVNVFIRDLADSGIMIDQ